MRQERWGEPREIRPQLPLTKLPPLSAITSTHTPSPSKPPLYAPHHLEGKRGYGLSGVVVGEEDGVEDGEEPEGGPVSGDAGRRQLELEAAAPGPDARQRQRLPQPGLAGLQGRLGGRAAEEQEGRRARRPRPLPRLHEEPRFGG